MSGAAEQRWVRGRSWGCGACRGADLFRRSDLWPRARPRHKEWSRVGNPAAALFWILFRWLGAPCSQEERALKPEGAVRLTVIPCELDEANAFVEQHHRHLGRVPGHRFSLAVADPDGKVRGVAIVGRPIGRFDQDGWSVQLLRSATDGCPNAPSALNGACRRVAFALGYRRLITFTLQSESGASMMASGFRLIGEAGHKDGSGWSCPSRPRVDKAPKQRKLRWEAIARAVPEDAPGSQEEGL